VRILLIVNASASSVTARGRVVIHKALSADHEVTAAETSKRGHATRLAQRAAAAGADVVVVLGGDGTLNEAANGLAGTDTALAALPGGSTNVFARTLGLPDDPIEATGALLDALGRNAVRRIGLGTVNGRYFLFHVGMGFDAAVVEQVERRAALKRWASHPLFVYAAFDTALRHYDRSRPRMAVHHADGSMIDDVYDGLCFNTNPYTYLGSMPINIAPDANLGNGLTVVSVRTLRMAPILALIGSALVNNGRRVKHHRLVDYRPDVASVVVTGYGPFPYQVDGDHLGETESLELRHVPGILSIVTP
jgi:diacylglycerol kinase family enzyme